MLTVTSLCKAVPGGRVLFQDLNLTVGKGQFVAITGESGVGKSTLLNLLAGLDRADAGSVVIGGIALEPLQDDALTRLRRDRIGFVFQAFHVLPHLDLAHNVALPLVLQKVDAHEALAKAAGMLEAIGLGRRGADYPRQLSGGELQRVAIAICLGTPADIYLVDEPSAYLDSEQRVITAKLLKRFIVHAKKTAFIVEHDFIMSTYLADRVVVYDGKPGIDCLANAPCDLLSGMNKFLSTLQITFRRDPTNNRPRINKRESVKDQEQKKSGNFFFMDNTD